MPSNLSLTKHSSLFSLTPKYRPVVMCRIRIGWHQLMKPPDHLVRASSRRHKDRACDITEPPSYITILEFEKCKLKFLNTKQIRYVLLFGLSRPCPRYRKALIATMKETQYITTKNKTNIFHARHSGSIRLYRPMCNMKARIHN